MWATADYHWKATQGTIEEDATPVSLVISLMDTVHNSIKETQSHESKSFLCILYLQLQSIINNNDIHVAVKSLTSERQSDMLRQYYQCLDVLQSAIDLDSDSMLFNGGAQVGKESMLFKAAQSGDAKLFAVFGGQGNIESYFDELLVTYQTYKPLIHHLITRSADTLAKHSQSVEAVDLRASPIELMQWLETPSSKPSTQSMLATSLSLPLIGLSQLLNYYIMLKVSRKTVSEYRQIFKATTGHSQGIISAAVISSASTHEEFIELTQKALSLLFWIGLRSQRAFPTTTISPHIIQGSVENNEGTPTPMLTVTGKFYLQRSDPK
jgi:fatty acid synthase subunit alpha, fungi type